jgi:sRNA-binding protein
MKLLRRTWPKAFPENPDDVRVLAPGVKKTIRDKFGWPHKKTDRILENWAGTDAYQKAVLNHPERITLDGTSSGVKVDDAMRERVRQRIDREIADHVRCIGILQERWPKAFPKNVTDVRPLARGVAKEIAQACGWSVRFAESILAGWRKRIAYQRARKLGLPTIKLDGTDDSKPQIESAA